MNVTWDWWNASNIFGVDFPSGINTETYKYYVDFAADSQIEYVILDEGWYVLGDLMKVNPDIDMQELLEYAEKKNVGIILWVVWKTLWDQMEALDQFEEWGIKGIKVDFMQRDDQWMVNYYWKVAEEAAKRKLLVDFHGSYKPAGLHRTWPNVLTREGVRGLEWSKWSDGASPENAVTIPFIRMLAGPMDYTPGAMTDWTARDLTVDLSFLGEGDFMLKAWKDGMNADRYAEDYTMEQYTVTAKDAIQLHLAPGGGYAAIITQ